jgi:hypothetical protein
MADLSDIDLLSRLQDALAPLPMQPDEKCIARLHEALAELAREDGTSNITSLADYRAAEQRPAPVRRRRFSSRSSVFIAGLVSFALTTGVAAAVVATNTLPGPTRAIAYDVGLPVASPSLYAAERATSQLQRSLSANDPAQQKLLGEKLITAMKSLDANDLSKIRSIADKLLNEVGLSSPSVSLTPAQPLTNNSVPSVTLPSTTVPTVTSPNVTIPKVTVPGLTTPSVTTPGVTIPKVSVPGLTTPSVTTPGVTSPGTTTPSVTIPKVTTPSVTTPSATTPNVTIPKVTVPGVKLPSAP